MKEILKKLFNHQTLTENEARQTMIAIAQNQYNDTEIAAFMSVFMMRNITLGELKGFRIFTPQGEKVYSAEDLGFFSVKEEEIFGGGTQEEAARIFRNILEGKGTESQNAVVLANATMALFSTEKYGDYQNCLAMATESLKEGKALACLERVVG